VTPRRHRPDHPGGKDVCPDEIRPEDLDELFGGTGWDVPDPPTKPERRQETAANSKSKKTKPKKVKPTAVGRVDQTESDGVDGEPGAAKDRLEDIGDGDDGWTDFLAGPAAYATAAQKRKALMDYAAGPAEHGLIGHDDASKPVSTDQEPDDGPEPEEPLDDGHVDDAGYDRMADDLPEDEDDDELEEERRDQLRREMADEDRIEREKAAVEEQYSELLTDSGTADTGPLPMPRRCRPQTDLIDHPFWRALQWTPARRALMGSRKLNGGDDRTPPDLRGPVVPQWVYRVTSGFPARVRLPVLQVLAVLAYWQSLDRFGRRVRCHRAARHGHYWVAKTREELAEETGLTAKQLRTALGQLRGTGLVLTVGARWAKRRCVLYRTDWSVAMRLWRQGQGEDGDLLTADEQTHFCNDGGVEQTVEELVTMKVHQAKAERDQLDTAMARRQRSGEYRR
jgi:hypothetical protein